MVRLQHIIFQSPMVHLSLFGEPKLTVQSEWWRSQSSDVWVSPTSLSFWKLVKVGGFCSCLSVVWLALLRRNDLINRGRCECAGAARVLLQGALVHVFDSEAAPQAPEERPPWTAWRTDCKGMGWAQSWGRRRSQLWGEVWCSSGRRKSSSRTWARRPSWDDESGWEANTRSKNPRWDLREIRPKS